MVFAVEEISERGNQRAVEWRVSFEEKISPNKSKT